MPKVKRKRNNFKITLCNNIFIRAGSKPLNQIHPLNIIQSPAEQNQKTTKKYQRQRKAGRKNIVCVILLITSEAERKVLGGTNT